jgi:hypothetical protein
MFLPLNITTVDRSPKNLRVCGLSSLLKRCIWLCKCRLNFIPKCGKSIFTPLLLGCWPFTWVDGPGKHLLLLRHADGGTARPVDRWVSGHLGTWSWGPLARIRKRRRLLGGRLRTLNEKGDEERLRSYTYSDNYRATRLYVLQLFAPSWLRTYSIQDSFPYVSSRVNFFWYGESFGQHFLSLWHLAICCDRYVNNRSSQESGCAKHARCNKLYLELGKSRMVLNCF